MILLFPDGRLASPRWRRVLWSYIGLCCGFLALLMAEASSVILAGHIQVDSNGQLTVFDHHSGWLTDTQAPILAAFMSFWLSFIASQALSWRRSSRSAARSSGCSAARPSVLAAWPSRPR